MEELATTDPEIRYTRRERAIALAAAVCLGVALWVAIERADKPEESEIMYEIPSGDEIEPAPDPTSYPNNQS